MASPYIFTIKATRTSSTMYSSPSNVSVPVLDQAFNAYHSSSSFTIASSLQSASEDASTAWEEASTFPSTRHDNHYDERFASSASKGAGDRRQSQSNRKKQEHAHHYQSDWQEPSHLFDHEARRSQRRMPFKDPRALSRTQQLIDQGRAS